MSVLVKGMDMPEYCEACPCYDWIEDICRITDSPNDFSDTRISDCPLVGIPMPHGRLIDADRLLALVEKEVNNTCIGCEPEPDDCCAYDRFKEIISEIKTAQTIIEAEVSE